MYCDFLLVGNIKDKRSIKKPYCLVPTWYLCHYIFLKLPWRAQSQLSGSIHSDGEEMILCWPNCILT